jgi:hypothetical protein
MRRALATFLLVCGCAHALPTVHAEPAVSGTTMFRTPNGALVHWDESQLPILVVPHPSMGAWREPIEQACAFWNQLIGQTVVLCTPPHYIPPEEVQPFEGPIVVLPGEETEAWLNADEETGTIAFGYISLADTEATPLVAFILVARAMGHVLGLAADDPARAPNSIMRDDIAGADVNELRVEPEDIRILRLLYGPIPVDESPKKLGI